MATIRNGSGNLIYTSPINNSSPTNVKNKKNLKAHVRCEMYQGVSLRVESLNPTLTWNVTLTNVTIETIKVNVPYSLGPNHCL